MRNSNILIIIILLSISTISHAGTALFVSQYESGMNTVCVYDYVGTQYKKTLPSIQICPMSINVGNSYSANASKPKHPIQKACLNYVSTGKKYKVDARVLMGSDLNRVTNSLNYTAYNRHVVVFWAEDKVSIIEMDNMYSDTLSFLEILGEDQEERKWKVRKATAYCY